MAPQRKAEATDLVLTAYRLDDRAPAIRPASARRIWMDRSPQGFAYRCLPLAIANSHGWELLTRVAFRAIWTGGDFPDAVRVESGAQPPLAPVSHFGCGVLTFHVPYLIQTPPGLNLWIGGAPNHVKDGIAPLSGVVETDWSPYGFTMNWRFTRPNYWVAFDEGEPFCFFFPVPRGLLEACVPEIRAASDAPELMRQNRAAQESRAEFLAELPVEGSKAHGRRWEKNYYRGLGPDGSPGSAAHQVKLQLRPFCDRTGKA
jgi:hypothetical protein